MKAACLIMILYALPLYAQQECEYKLYVDSLHGFSLQIPKQQSVKDIPGNYRYKVFEKDQEKYYFDVETKRSFINDFLILYLKEVTIESGDTLLAVAKVKARDRQHLRLTGVTSYNRINSLSDWIIDNKIRIIEFDRTLVFKQPDGTTENEDVGPIYYVNITTSNGNFVLTFNFHGYPRKFETDFCRKIVSSIKVIE